MDNLDCKCAASKPRSSSRTLKSSLENCARMWTSTRICPRSVGIAIAERAGIRQATSYRQLGRSSGPEMANVLARVHQGGFKERPLSALDAMFTRRSVRAYTAQTLDESTIRALWTLPCRRRPACTPSHGRS